MFMLLTWVMSLGSAVLIFVEVGGWVQDEKSRYHAYFGVATNLLCFVQPFMAAMRPHPGASKRALFNWAHWLVGNAAHICASKSSPVFLHSRDISPARFYLIYLHLLISLLPTRGLEFEWGKNNSGWDGTRTYALLFRFNVHFLNEIKVIFNEPNTALTELKASTLTNGMIFLTVYTCYAFLNAYNRSYP